MQESLRVSFVARLNTAKDEQSALLQDVSIVLSNDKQGKAVEALARYCALQIVIQYIESSDTNYQKFFAEQSRGDIKITPKQIRETVVEIESKIAENFAGYNPIYTLIPE